LIDVYEVDYGENRQNYLKTENRGVLLYRHEVTLLDYARENERLQEDCAAYAA
jgi:hypothetical protein